MMAAVTLAAYAAAVACVAVILAATLLVGRAGQRRLLPDAPAALRLAAGGVLGIGFLVLATELLGACGVLSRGPLVGVGAGASLAALRVTRGLPPPSCPVRWPARLTAAHVAATTCVALVTVEVASAVAGTGRTGTVFLDALQYHLVWAAHFATTHSTTGYIHTGIGDTTTYYPLNDELLHAAGMIAVGRDTLSLLIAAGEIGLMFLAAYAVGQQFGEGPLAICAVSPLLATFGGLDASAINDWGALWPFLVGVAVLLYDVQPARSISTRTVVVVGLGTGLGIGTKLDMLAPGLLLGLAVVLLTRGQRVRGAALLLASGLLTGGFWLIRNFVTVGSPIPAEHIPGLPRIPLSVTDSIATTVAHYATDPHVWRTGFAPALRLYLGDAWPVVLILSLLGIFLAVARPRRPGHRALAVVAALATVAYLFTPTTAGGPQGAPFYFVFNIRYDLAALSLGVLLLCSTSLAARLRLPLSLIFLVVLLFELTEVSNWAPSQRLAGSGAAVILLLAAAALLACARHRAAATRPAVMVLAGAVVVVGYPLQQGYLRDRYTPPAPAALTHAGASSPPAVLGLFSSLAGTTGQRVGIVGRPATYPFLGPRWHNRVSLLGRSLPHHAFENFDSCAGWRQASGRMNYVVIADNFGKPPPALGWTRTDPAAQLVFEDAAGAVFRIGPGYASAHC